jgi:hypothetical protein
MQRQSTLHLLMPSYHCAPRIDVTSKMMQLLQQQRWSCGQLWQAVQQQLLLLLWYET